MFGKMHDKILLKLVNKQLSLLSEEEQLEWVKKCLNTSYDLKESLSTEFYQYALVKIKNGDLDYFRKRNIFQVIDDFRSVPFHIKTLENVLTPKQYLDIPIRHIKQLKALLEQKLNECPTNEIDLLYSSEDLYKLSRHTSFKNEECIILAYYLYLVFGLNYSVNLLQNKYGNISFKTIAFWLYSIDLKNISELNIDYLKFLFGDNINNNIMNNLLKGKNESIYLNFGYLYENFNYFQSLFNGKLSLKRVNELLKERFVKDNPLYPEFRADVIGDIKSSSRYNESVSDLKDENYNFYEDYIINLYKATIPQIHVEYENLYGDILAKKDAKNLVMGYRANNCFHLNGDAKILFMKALSSKHFRVLSISRKNSDDIAMVLIARNGNVLIAQGIEISKAYQDYESKKKIYEMTNKVMLELMDTMNKDGDLIVASLIGASNNNVLDFNNNILPFRVSPIIDNKQYFYDGFHFPQCLLCLKDGCSLNDISLYEPTKEYLDEREEILHVFDKEYDYRIQIVRQRVLAISIRANTQYSRIQKCLDNEIKEIYCNVDWYIIVFENGEIESACLDYDFRAKEEYENCLSNIKNNLLKRKRC
mgnify:CR=1 FL=1